TLAVAACANLMQRGIIPTFPLPNVSPDVHLSGRMEQIERDGKKILIDGAHTPASARRLRAVIDRIAPSSPVHLVIGMLRDKSAHDFLTEFNESRFHITLTQAPSH